MTVFIGDELAQVSGPQVRAAVLLRIGDGADALRIWGGVGDLAIPADALEPGGATYLGMGELIGLPAVSQLINGVAQQVTFVLNGVDADILALVDEDAAAVRFARARLGFVAMDQHWQLSTAVKWLWQGAVETPECAQAPADGDQPATRSVSLTVSSGLTARRRPRASFYTDADQRRRSATDRFCERVVFYSQGSTRKFGPV